MSRKVIVSTDNGTSTQIAGTDDHALVFFAHALAESNPGRVVIIVEPHK